ncbi:ATP-grasp domain-containing protein [Lacrimispora sp. 210928-DFI.3.58]|uniref:ATP-grasp domain-containing protein n=1 Tax=Lacrimispora sp. 210928-DFI.3.58 TaxID=2883214 RepID=UPI001D08AFC7|nr:ATP-grasp domain-containing protein [Lacrimispora sp. 210928-DFI.3.58]MCB7319861.1 ATP-grasp domain-containing protein [Lacrimispora sp. 210928-DFI.3.58]
MNATKKRLLIIGAGRGQVGLYKAAKEMGIHTIAGTMKDNNPPGIKLADEVCYMNIANPNEVLEKAKTLQLDGVATCCLDTGVPALGKVCDALKLTGLTEDAAIMCGDKLKMKRAFMEHNVSTARFYEISNETELNVALEKLQLPVIIKATDLQGSNGIYISKTREAAFNGFKEAMKKTKKSYCIVEEYIEGWEFGAQAFVYNGQILFVMPHGDETYMSHTAVPVGHYVPLGCNMDVHEQTKVAVKNAITALGLNNCAVNVDLILKDNTVYVIELTGRVGANCLPELVQINFGIEYYKMIVAMALGENPLEFWEKKRESTKAGLAKMILETEKSGVLDAIEYKGEIAGDVLEVTFFKHPGDEIRIFENSNDCVGQIIVQGETMEECQKKLDKVISEVVMKLR